MYGIRKISRRVLGIDKERVMKKRNLEYEAKFRKYLFSFNFENHKDICKNINVRHNQNGL